MWALMIVACTNSMVPEGRTSTVSTPVAVPPVAEPNVPRTPGDPTGAWYVVWDRSSTGWRPPTFNGVMVLGVDSAALDFQESSGTYTLDSVKVDGSNFELVARIQKWTPPPDAAENVKAASAVDTVVSIRGFVEEDKLYGYMEMIGAPGHQVSWTPFSGKRAMLTSPPAVMPRSAPTP